MPEAMTTQDAIETLEIFRNDYTREGSDLCRAIDIAIDELRQHTTSLELIERQEALEIAMSYCPDDDGSCSKAGHDIREMLDEIEALPTIEVKPVQKPKMNEADRKKGEEWCKDCEHIEMCAWYPFGGCDFRLLSKPEVSEDAGVRPIDANALKKNLSEFNYDMALRIVDIQPTIEAEPVQHGEWLEWRYTDTVCTSLCTNCGNVATQARVIVGQELMTKVRYPLCPNCGARMDGVTKK